MNLAAGVACLKPLTFPKANCLRTGAASNFPQASILGISAGSGVTDWTMACAVLATPPRMSLRASGSSDNLASATVDRKDGLE